MLFIKFLFFSLYFHIAFVILNVNKEEKDEGEKRSSGSPRGIR